MAMTIEIDRARLAGRVIADLPEANRIGYVP